MPAPMMMPTPPAVTSTRPSTRWSRRTRVTASLRATALPGARRATSRRSGPPVAAIRRPGGVGASQRGGAAPLGRPASRDKPPIHRGSWRGMDVAPNGHRWWPSPNRPGGHAMKLTTILVPLDGSVVAEAALSPAVDLARDAGARLVLLRAAEARSLPMADPVEAQVSVMWDAQEYLAAARARADMAGVADVEVSAWYGPPVQAIVEAARSRDVDLIVMSSHGRSGMARLVMGS